METETIKPVEEKPLSIVEEAKLIRDEILKAKDDIKEEREKLEKVKADEVLGSSAGGHVEPVAKAEVAPEDYIKQVMSGEVGDDKE